MKTQPSLRVGFTLAEVVMAFLVLSVTMLVVAQLSVQGIRDRLRSQGRNEALEVAANILEAARAEPWAGLTPEWAAGHQLPEPVLRRLPEGRLKVQVEPEMRWVHVKRVTVEVSWKQMGPDRASLQLVGFFGERALRAEGGKP